MNVVFVSNYFNHHQMPFSDCMFELTSGEYRFVQMEEMAAEREKMGWSMAALPSYVTRYSEDENGVNNLILNADVVICSNGYESLMKERFKRNRLVFIYGERLYKTDINRLKLLKHAVINYLNFGGYRNCYCLCSSAYASYDWSRSRAFLNKCFKWGYFTKSITYSTKTNLMSKKNKDTVAILFVARQIELKHPELPVRVLKKLCDEGIEAELTMIGDGPLTDEIKKNVSSLGLNGRVTIIPSVLPTEVRKYMEAADIFLFTSDKNEGWGAVMNESMNSGCAVVASSAIGSVPYLINNGINGFIYEDGIFNDLYEKTKKLAVDKELRKKLGTSAYETIINEWSEYVAAERFIKLSSSIINRNTTNIYQSGPCSIAQIIKDGWFRQDD